MRLATPIVNENLSIMNRLNQNGVRNSILSGISSIYYLDYLFKMKDIRPKFNGKIIPKINGDIIIKNSIKHLQSFLQNELESYVNTVSRSANTICVEPNICVENNNYMTYINSIKSMLKTSMINSNNFSIINNEELDLIDDSIFLNNDLTMSAAYMSSSIQAKIDEVFADLFSRFNIQIRFHPLYSPNMRWRSLVPNQIGYLDVRISKNYFEREYDRAFGHQFWNITGTGSQLAQDITYIPVKIRELIDLCIFTGNSLVTSAFQPNVSGSDFVRLLVTMNTLLVNLNSTSNNIFRNQCANVINNITASFFGSSNRGIDVSAYNNESFSTSIREVYSSLNTKIQEIFIKIAEVNNRLADMRNENPIYTKSLLDSIGIKVDFRKIDTMLQILGMVVSYYQNVRTYSVPVINPQGINWTKNILTQSEDNPRQNVTQVSNGLYFNDLQNYFFNIIDLFMESIDSEYQNVNTEGV